MRILNIYHPATSVGARCARPLPRGRGNDGKEGARSAPLRLTVAVVACLLLFVSAAHAQLAESFESVAGWRPIPSDGVELKISQDEGYRGRAMRLDFDFRGGAGYAIARRDGAIELPDNFQFSFWLKAESPVNNLEFKLVDPTGENVWWVNRREYEFPRGWRRVTLKKRHFSFAWGPAGGGEPRHLGAIEIVVTAGTGGKGTVWVDELTLTPLDPPTPYNLTPRVTASAGPATASQALDRNPATAWRSPADGEQSITIDFLRMREFSGLAIDWDPEDFATDYDVQISMDGVEWETIDQVALGNGGRDFIFIPETDARWLRLRLAGSSRGRGYGVREIEVKPLEWATNPNEFFTAIAREAPRGHYPRYFHGEQLYWTVIGVDGDTREALISEDGAIEGGTRDFSVEPFLYLNGRLLTWADASSSQSLADGYLPVPSVEWHTEPLTLNITAFAAGAQEHSSTYVRYRVTNRGPAAVTPTLFLALRPFQVNPPWQFLGKPAGVGSIREVMYHGDVAINGRIAVIPLTRPVYFGAAALAQGSILEFLREGRLPSRMLSEDQRGFTSGALSYGLPLAPGETKDVWIALPLHQAGPNRQPEKLLATVLDDWRRKLNRVTIRLPEPGRRLIDAVRSNLAYILINRDDSSIQPGSRSYERSWIRDGSLTSAALLRLRQFDTVAQFVQWYAPFQFPNGKVPCCVGRAADPVPEHDSHGQLIYLIAEYYRFTRDQDLVDQLWPHVVKAVDYIDSLRRERMTPQYAATPFYGLVPESISHEGYSAKPMHSYWDDLFVLKGLKDATEIATILGKQQEAARFAALRDEFRGHLIQSLRLAMARHGIDYLPGSVELGDFDATSTTVALAPVGEHQHLPAKALARTFEKYWENHLERVRQGTWDAYTPYEFRTVGTFVRLGQKQRAHQLLDFFFAHQRPKGWNHWAEVVWREPRTAKFIGDMPHTWVGSDFIRSFFDMLAYEQDDGSLVLAAGIPFSWVSMEPGVVVENLATHYGTLNFTMKGDERQVRLLISGDARPPGGVLVHSPSDRPLRRVTADRPVDSDARTVRVPATSLPIEVTLHY